MPSDRRSRMSMNNEARNLRLSILLFFQPSARLASARHSGPHTRIGYRSSIHACVCTRPHMLSDVQIRTCVWERICVGGSYVSKTKLMPRESSSALGVATRPMHRYRKRRDIRRKKGRETCCWVWVCRCIYIYGCVHTPRWRGLRGRPTYMRHEYLRRERDTPSHSVDAVSSDEFSTAMDVVWFLFSFFFSFIYWICTRVPPLAHGDG